MNEFITKVLNFFPLEIIAERSWEELALILTPSVVAITALFGFGFFLRNRKWRYSAYLLGLTLALAYLPFELHRQSTAMSRANANIAAMHDNLQQMLDSSGLGHLRNAVNPQVSTDILDDLIHNLDHQKKKDLILISWLITENEKNSLRHIADKQTSLASEIRSSLSETKAEIIDSRPPVEQISDTIVQRLDNEITQMIEKRMHSFKEEIDSSLGGFKEGVSTVVQSGLTDYQDKLARITQQNIDELRNYSGKVTQVFTDQVNKVNQESLQKMDATKASIDGIGATISDINLKNIAQQVKQLKNSMELSQRKNDILFEYNECVRTAGLLDLGGKTEHCRNKFNQDMNELQ